MVGSRGYCVFFFGDYERGRGGRTDAWLIGIFPSADPLSLDEKRSGTKLAWGSRQRRLPRRVRPPPPPVCHNSTHTSNFNTSQFFILNAENSSFPISSKYDFTILAIPLCATKRYVLSGCALISSSRLYIRCAR